MEIIIAHSTRTCFFREASMKGGKREGAGRKSTGINQKPMNFKIDLENVEILSQQKNKNRFINELIRQSTKIT